MLLRASRQPKENQTVPEAKTKATTASVAAYLAAITDPSRQADCRAISELMRRITQHAPVMWGSSMVGFGSYRYTYASGHSGEFFQIGFAARKGDISIYLVAGSPGQDALLARLGKHKMGKACLYVRRLADIDLSVLEQLVSESVAEIKRRHGAPA